MYRLQCYIYIHRRVKYIQTAVLHIHRGVKYIQTAVLHVHCIYCTITCAADEAWYWLKCVG